MFVLETSIWRYIFLRSMLSRIIFLILKNDHHLLHLTELQIQNLISGKGQINWCWVGWKLLYPLPSKLTFFIVPLVRMHGICLKGISIPFIRRMYIWSHFEISCTLLRRISEKSVANNFLLHAQHLFDSLAAAGSPLFEANLIDVIVEILIHDFKEFVKSSPITTLLVSNIICLS